MRGLLLKDIYTIVKQLKVFLLIIIIFACLPGYYSLSAFAIVYASMLPITAVAYDERSKWNRLAAMMPYSVKSLVFSKYILGYLMVAAAAMISVAAQLVLTAVTGSAYGIGEVQELICVICIAIFLLSVNLPLMFRFGVEKGRLTFIILTVVTVMLLFSVKDKVLVWLAGAGFSASTAFAALVVFAVLSNLASFYLSLKFHKGKFA